MEVVLVVIGLLLAVFFTARFLLSLGKPGPFLPKFREWLKNVFDAIT